MCFYFILSTFIFLVMDFFYHMELQYSVTCFADRHANIELEVATCFICNTCICCAYFYCFRARVSKIPMYKR